MDEALLEEIRLTLRQAVDALAEAGHIQPGGLIVLGCSTSEVAGARIGKGSVPELGEVIARAMLEACQAHGLEAAFQCCEHLNRAVVMEQRVLKELRLTQVRAIPQPKAGGSVPAAAWKLLDQPALAMAVQADAAIDVGDTLVGMHIRPVAVPLRLDVNHVGHANLVMAYSRLPYIGGSRAVYE
ncbi:MAG: TIGR01440 family protein [Eubacteriales bacterium]|nr:TIGR01440 family protein [Eubacteriales bacterium]